MKTNSKIFLIALMAMVGSNVWADGTTFPVGTYVFEFKTNFTDYGCQEVNLFEPSAMRDKVDDINISLPENSGIVMGDGRKHYYRTDGNYINYLVLTINTQYTASFNDQFMDVRRNGSWVHQGERWTEFGTHTLSPVTVIGTTNVYLCIVYSDATFEWSTDATKLPPGYGDPVLHYSAGANGSITTHTVNGAEATSGKAYKSGDVVELTATPTTAGYVFSSWTNSSSVVVSTSATYGFTLTSSVSLTANFVLDGSDPVINNCDGCFSVAP